ncbi:putative D,D-dipeptide transport system permease protein DdpC [Eubacteriaceae bacterium CHKCI004]|nr:putative D,D-dipeptide transport system permease protein DdpC [Eubacteriaceae bacterium CHKCI004]
MKVKNFIIKNKSFCVFSFLALLIILIAIFAPVITGGVSPSEAVLTDALQPPSSEHIFGTDKLGRDIFTRVIYGARTSLVAAFSVVILIFVLGTILGVLSGYFGGWVDAVIMRIADLMVSFPGMVFAMAIAGIMGASIRNAVIAVALVSWTKYARLARSLVLKVRNRDYVAAAVVTGSKTSYILRKYMVPNVIPTLIITGATDIGGMMLELAGLSFLGFGAKAPTPEWGLMLNEGRQFIQNASWMMVFPGAAIFIVVVVFNLLGDALRDVLDPKNE